MLRCSCFGTVPNLTLQQSALHRTACAKDPWTNYIFSGQSDNWGHRQFYVTLVIINLLRTGHFRLHYFKIIITLKYNLISTVHATEIILQHKFLTLILLGKQTDTFFDVLLTVYLSIFISIINQLDAHNFCFTISLFHVFTCFEHMCSSSGGQNCGVM